MDKLLKNRLIEKAKKIYGNENTGHDFSHIERVLNYCAQIQKHENADWDVIFVSALYHDVHRVMADKVGRFVPPAESLDEVKEALAEFNLDEEFLSKVLYVVAYHDDKNMNVEDMTKELQIVQDADILDAVGEVGLKRTLKYCKAKHIPVTNTEYPLDTDQFIPDVRPISTVHYITRTMIPQVAYIHTDSAKQLANDQAKILEDFVHKSLKEHNVDQYEI